MAERLIEDVAYHMRHAGILAAGFGGDCYHVTLSMPNGGTRELDAFLFDGDAFTGDREHDPKRGASPFFQVWGQTAHRLKADN